MKVSGQDPSMNSSSFILHPSSFLLRPLKGSQMKRLLALAALAASSALAQPHPLNFNDLISLHRVGAPQLSPDGKWIAYDAATPDLAANASRSALFLMPANGGAAKQITEGKKQDSSPAWSPDGKTIAFVSNRDSGEAQIYLYDVAAGTSKKRTDLPGGAGALKWL